MAYKKKLIEVALPLDAINAESAREKSIRHGHPSTLHLWWSRKPTATARAVIWASLVDDPSAHPEQFPTEREQEKERRRLFRILEELVKWENANDKRVLDAARAEILKSTDGNPPPLLDPFAGGGTIPLEAQRLGLEAHAHDLNPVAVMINKAMIEIPPKFAGQPPVHPEAQRNKLTEDDWSGTRGLAEDVRYYGEWMKQRAFEKIGHLYPKVADAEGKEHTVIAWLWARTVKCPNPACGCEMPLLNAFALSKKKNAEVSIDPALINGKVSYQVKQGKKDGGTVNRKGAMCVLCDTPVDFSYIRQEGKDNRIGKRLLAIIAETKKGRVYLSPDMDSVGDENTGRPDDYPNAELPKNPRDFKTPNYGMRSFADLFTNRQLTALTTLSDLISAVRVQVVSDGGSEEYAQAICSYLSFAVDRTANRMSTLCVWNRIGEKIEQTFARQAIPMIWEFAEANIFSNSTGSWSSSLEWIPKCIEQFPATLQGVADQADAQGGLGMRNVMISTDPPYYDMIGYADLSDFFYIWMRQALKDIYPELFRTMLVPKEEELIATPYRFEGSADRAKEFFEHGMSDALLQIYHAANNDIPITIYYAFKQTETDKNNNTASTGWETMLSAILNAGLLITATWPIRTERPTGLKAFENALASSIVLVCRKRPTDAPVCTRRDFLTALKRELKPALVSLQESNIAPVDMAQSAIGPGMAVYSRYAQVLEAEGAPMTVRTALQLINQELDQYFSEQDGALDRDTIFCVALYTQYAFREVKFGDVDVLARAKNTSTDRLREKGILYAERGTVRLLRREEIAEQRQYDASVIWQVVQRLAYTLEEDGVEGAAEIAAALSTESAEKARALAYRLFQTAERRGWAQDAFAYNTLVTNWRDIQERVARMQKDQAMNQGGLFAE
ncbi:MAG: DUF1156 domain-containing protein [Selenomonas noxia]|uniref:DUF1156 domain-containing protein n=1 Tax=Selenomonas noxia TaxID=135083 RepID=UPI001CAC88BE|nr:DUF1156 domain-containing protein [Selenomonas noxia]MBF1662769.1 DUF1156 domain-containing protein [Selenomonas noxia]